MAQVHVLQVTRPSLPGVGLAPRDYVNIGTPDQGVVTTIPAVLTPATGGFDPMPLRTPQKVGGHLRILQIGQKINEFSSRNQAIKVAFQ